MAEKSFEQFHLSNGVTVEFQPDESWQAVLYTQTPFIASPNGEYQYAANHLIEHCLKNSFRGSNETHSTIVKYPLPQMKNRDEALEIFNQAGEALKAPQLDDLELERERIIEEWSPLAPQGDKMKFLGGMLLPVTYEQFDIIDENISAERGVNFMNRQADYTRALSADELQKHALFMYGGENLHIRLQAPLTPEEARRMMEQSSISEIPRQHPNAEQIRFKDVPEQMNYLACGSSEINFSFSRPSESADMAREIFKSIRQALGNDPTLALYWSDRISDTKDETSEMWSFRISKSKEDLLKIRLTDYLSALAHDENINSDKKSFSAHLSDQFRTQEKTNRIDQSFDKMIQSLQPNELAYPSAPKKGSELLSVEEKRKTISALGRYLYKAHPGFSEDPQAKNIAFSKETQTKIKEELLKLYLSPEAVSVDELTKSLHIFGQKYIPDNHFNVFTAEGAIASSIFSKEELSSLKTELLNLTQQEGLDPSQKGKLELATTPRNQVGQNLFADSVLENLKQNGAQILDDQKGRTWRISEIEQNGKKLTMIGLTQFHAFEDKGFSADLINDFTAFAKEFSKQKYTESDGVIVDLRGNGGGWPYLGDYMARTFYGNEVAETAQTSLKRDTFEARLSMAFMAKTPSLNRFKIPKTDAQDHIDRTEETWSSHLPFNPDLGYKKPVLVLTDRSTGSNAEATCTRMKPNPYVRFLGDNTQGCIQYTPAATGDTAIPLPYGIKVGIPINGKTSPDGHRLEGMGNVPDYAVPHGTDALSYALDHFEQISKDISEKCPKFQSIEASRKRDSYIDRLTEKLEYLFADDPIKKQAIHTLSEQTKIIPSLRNLNRETTLSPHLLSAQEADRI